MIVQKSLPSRRLFLNGIGVVILLIGINVSGFLYLRSSENPETLDAQNSIVLPEDSRIYQRTVAMYAGTFGLLADEWTRDLESLGEPKPLSIIIIVFSILVSGGFFYKACRPVSIPPRKD